MMRKLTSYLFISLDGVVEAPEKFVRPELYQDFPDVIGETTSQQDAVLLGRKIYEEWSHFWPSSKIEPFATFINKTPKYVVSARLREISWGPATLISQDFLESIAGLKAQQGKDIGVHGVGLIQTLLLAGLMDELRLILIPVIAGSGRRLLEHSGGPIQMDLQSAQSTTTGLQLLAYRPRR